MTQERLQTGKKGEEIAAAYLKGNGYTIIEKNYRNRFGEIDIIARDKNAVVFIEIKTRRTSSPMFGPPQIAVSYNKQKKIIKTSIGYIKHRKIERTNFRYDVIAVTLLSDGSVKEGGIVLIKNAFQTGG